MITSINAENSSRYQALFDSAYDFLVANKSRLGDREEAIDQMTGITSIQEYFAHIEDLLSLGEEGKRYLMLPLDEPHFIINANSREIIIPAEFKKNGVSVLGDQIAESLIFEVNRFFDYADLANMDVTVQWETKNNHGISSTFVTDKLSDPDHLYIMWPLSDELTQEAGVLKFSVRFYQKKDDALNYSFSTKVASVTINQGHDFIKEDVPVVNAASKFIGAIKNSQISASENVIPPFFIENLDDQGSETQIVNADTDLDTDGVLEAYIDEDNPTQTLEVEVGATDTGNVSFEWHYVDFEDPTYRTNGLTYYLVGQDEYTPINEPGEEIPEEEPGKIYYAYNSEKGKYERVPYSIDTNSPQLYTRKNKTVVQFGMPGTDSSGPTEVEHIPDVVGKYFVVAKLTKGNAAAEIQSYTINFPGPDVLKFTDPVDTNDVNGGDLNPNAYLDENVDDIWRGSISTQVEIDTRGAKASYIWCWGQSSTGPWYPVAGPVSALSAAEQARLAATEIQEDVASSAAVEASVDGSALTIIGKPGFYKVFVISTRNYKNSPALESSVCKVTEPLQAPHITYPDGDIAISSARDNVVLRVEVEEINDPLRSEGFTYQWFDDQHHALEGETNPTLVVEQGTRMGYYCEVTNHMGADTATARSDDFSVNRLDTPEENSEG